MKIVLYSILVAYTLLISFPAHAQDTGEWYEKGRYGLHRTDPDQPLVQSFDISRWLEKVEPAYEIERTAYYWHDAVFYQFRGEDHFTVRIGIHPSIPHAEERALDGLNRNPGVYYYGEYDSTFIGDNMWWLNGFEGGGGIYVIRKNCIFIVGAPYFDWAMQLAASIDDALLHDTDIADIRETIVFPEITSLTTNKEVLALNERTTINLTYSNPLDENIHIVGGPDVNVGNGVYTTSFTKYNPYDEIRYYSLVTDGNVFSPQESLTIGF